MPQKMSPRHTILWCMLLLFLATPVPGHAAWTSGLTCGALVPPVAAHCGFPTASNATNCCAVLRTWNDAACWCEPAAMSLMSQIATNDYAFSARDVACNIKNVMRPAVYSRFGDPNSTCPSEFANVDFAVKEDPHNCTITSKTLRQWRYGALNILDMLHLNSSSAADIAAFKKSLEVILEPTVVFSNIGQISLFGAADLTDYLLARQSALGCTAPIFPSSNRRLVFWRDTSTVSYGLEIATPTGVLSTRYVFADFTRCSGRLRSLSIAESPFVSAEYGQYFYSKGPSGVVGQFDIPAEKLCEKISVGCTGPAYPYASKAECIKEMGALKTAKKVMCNRFSAPYVPQLALHGNSIACRATFAAIAKLNPGKYCPMLAKNAIGICSESACPRGLYSDIFTDPNPRHDGSSGGFLCKRSSGQCTEQWP